MRIRLLFSASALVMAFCFSTTLGAQETDSAQENQATQPRSENFGEADTDSDGFLTSEELQGYVELNLPNFKNHSENMKRLDFDRDGKISPEEFTRRKQVVKGILSEGLATKDGTKVTEFADGFNKRFKRRKPKLGSEIKDLIAFDENGDKLNFEDLRGKYTVLNFGCLT